MKQLPVFSLPPSDRQLITYTYMQQAKISQYYVGGLF